MSLLQQTAPVVGSPPGIREPHLQGKQGRAGGAALHVLGPAGSAPPRWCCQGDCPAAGLPALPHRKLPRAALLTLALQARGSAC